MSEGLTIAVVAGIFGVLAGVPAAVSAVLTSRTRKVAEKQAKENTEQHGESQRLMGEVVRSVGELGGKGGAVTSGLRKVTDDMKSKNQPEKTGAVPAAARFGNLPVVGSTFWRKVKIRSRSPSS